jgi:hypothetical protein
MRKQYLRQDTVQRELERFAYDIAESVVTTMERQSDKVGNSS